MRRGIAYAIGLALASSLIACGDDGGGGGDDDTITTEHCTYEALPPTAGNGGTVSAGTLEAGAAEAVMGLPVSSALGAYTARAGFLGSAGTVDIRRVALSGNFNPSIGIESAPRVRAVALTAGGETVVIVKVDLGAAFEGMVFDLEERLGSGFEGKVLISASHTHSGWGHFTAHSAYQMGFGVYRQESYDHLMGVLESTAKAALDARRPAKIGFYATLDFDPDDVVTRDRRGENNDMMGGPRKDDAFFMIRIDGTDDEPIAMIPIYGVHGTLQGESNSLASTDSIGGLERVLEEQFEREVVIMHLQGAGGDVSPVPAGRLNCDIRPGDPDDPCFEWLQAEAHGRNAAPLMLQAWEAAGQSMQSSIELEMLTRSVELGPNHETFTIRDGALEYAPFTYDREADGEILDSSGNIISPIDEFSAPTGAGLCENEEVMFGAGTMPGTDDLYPYGSCASVHAMSDIFEILLDTTFESDRTHPICQSTRTSLSALRIGDYVFGTIPGEATVMLADMIRDRSPVDRDKTVVLGYAQGHMGYALIAEDWIAGGYEASINIWGPLEGEYLVEQLVDLMPLATTPAREDGTTGGVDRWVHPITSDTLPIDDPAPMAGTIPTTIPEQVWTRTGTKTSAQPAATVPRVSGVATFIWIGDDPKVATPQVTVEREVSAGTWQPIARRSGRTVTDGAVVIGYTPLPLRREGTDPQTYYWVAEFQAVPWLGADDDAGNPLDDLSASAGLPLGNYRFRVVGDSFDITSDPFQVTEADLSLSVTRNGTSFSTNVSVHAPLGFRLLDINLPSNQPVPVRGGTFDVSIAKSAGPDQLFQDVVADADGNVVIDAGGDADIVTAITVTDAFGNTKTAPVGN